jgi:NAD(P)H-dependent flavin oxidoreductase YrpB (nitropropane dioxygenase family)
MRTRVAEMLGVEFPICAFSHCRDVVAAVSNAGGLGVLGAVAHSPQRLETELTWIEEQTGGKPFGVDLLLPPKYVGAEQGGIDTKQARELLPEEHRAFVDDLLVRYGISVPTDEERLPPGDLNISPKGYEPLLDVAFAHRIRLIASALGSPPPDLVTRARDNDVLVAALAGTTEHARRHAAAGVDLIVAQGTEAGGHTGQVSTMVLVPEVVDAVAPVPVLAAGGIARGVGVRRGGCVVRLSVVDHRGGRNAARRKGQVLGRHLVGHRAIAFINRQARAHAAHRLDGGMGAG